MKKCQKCEKPSLKGLKIPLCQYHYNVLACGKTWADYCENPDFIGTDEEGKPRYREK